MFNRESPAYDAIDEILLLDAKLETMNVPEPMEALYRMRVSLANEHRSYIMEAHEWVLDHQTYPLMAQPPDYSKTNEVLDAYVTKCRDALLAYAEDAE